MANDISERRRTQKPVASVSATHKFAVGSKVYYREGTNSGLFRVTRQLPDGGRGLQYRIRSDSDGVERGVTESTIERA